MGRSPCCRTPDGLKKGSWKPEEDEKLVSYISQHGHGNWQALPKKCGLLRCGKSCRLRWTNYLRPDIKRGGFTRFEEQKIIQLHAFVGNKWAFIASHLPKRTDNEIKNYWNTVLKKRLHKLGLPTETAHSQNSAIEKFNTCVNNKHSLNRSANHPTPNNIWQLQQQQTMLSISTKSAAMNDNAGPINQENAANSLNSLMISIDTAMRSKEHRTTSDQTASHLAQWEMARLEAEARLSCKQSDLMSHASRPKSDWISCHSPNPPPLNSTPSANSTALMAALQLSSPGTDHEMNMNHASGGLAMASHEQQVISVIDSSQNDDHAGLDGVVIDGELDQNMCNNVLSGDVSSASENMSMNASSAMALTQQTDLIGTMINAADGHNDEHVNKETGIILNGELLDQSMSDLISDGAINGLQELLLDTASSSATSQTLPRHSTSMQSPSNQELTPGMQQLKEALQDWLLDNNDADDLITVNFSFRRRFHT